MPGGEDDRLSMFTEDDLHKLETACRGLTRITDDYESVDFLTALMETVLDYRQRSTTVERAVTHFRTHPGHEIGTLEDLEQVFLRYPNDKEGNIALSQFLWGYKFWTRAEQLRSLVDWARQKSLNTFVELREWATASSFSDFRGQVGGLGITAYHGLVARLGVQTAIPDPNILRFVQNAVGRPFTEQEVVEALNIVAQRLGVAPRDLDHSIWNLSANYEG